MNEAVRKLFDEAAQAYDGQRRQLIPCFDDFYGTAALLVRTDRSSPSILDLGAGTGLLTAWIAARVPKARFTLMDFSESMLRQAQARFAGMEERMRYVQCDYAAAPLGGKYDYIVSSLSIHHLTHEAKRELFRKIADALTDGGVFINADQVAGESPFYDAYYRERWEESVMATGLDPAAFEASKERRKLDINAKLGDQLAWLREAGFAEADCVYRHYDFAVFHARKGNAR